MRVSHFERVLLLLELVHVPLILWHLLQSARSTRAGDAGGHLDLAMEYREMPVMTGLRSELMRWSTAANTSASRSGRASAGTVSGSPSRPPPRRRRSPGAARCAGKIERGGVGRRASSGGRTPDHIWPRLSSGTFRCKQGQSGSMAGWARQVAPRASGRRGSGRRRARREQAGASAATRTSGARLRIFEVPPTFDRHPAWGAVLCFASDRRGAVERHSRKSEESR